MKQGYNILQNYFLVILNLIVQVFNPEKIEELSNLKRLITVSSLDEGNRAKEEGKRIRTRRPRKSYK